MSAKTAAFLLCGLLFAGLCLAPAGLALLGIGGCLDSLALPRVQFLLARSLASSALVALLATALGGLYGFTVGATDLPQRRGFALAGLLPLALPTTVASVAWLDLTQQLARWGLSPGGWTAVVATQVLAYFPLVGLAVWVGVRQLDPTLEEAGRLAVGVHGTWRRVTLPLLAPYWAMGALVVFLFAFNDAAVPSLFQVSVFAVEVSASLGTFLDARQAAALSGPPALVLLTAAGALFWLWSRGSRGVQHWRPDGTSPTWRLGKWQSHVSGLLTTLITAAAAVPTLWLALRALDPQALKLAWEQGGADLLRTLTQSVGVAGLTVALGFALALSTPRRWRHLQAAFVLAALLTLFLPPALLVGAWHRWLPDGPALAAGVFLGRYLVFPLAIAQARRAQLDPALEEAAALVSPGLHARLLPGLYGRTALGSAMLVYLLVTADLSTHLLADPPGWGSLPVRIFSLAHYGRIDALAVLCLAEVGLLLLPLALLWRRL